jgi:hypothetical protein
VDLTGELVTRRIVMIITPSSPVIRGTLGQIWKAFNIPKKDIEELMSFFSLDEFDVKTEKVVEFHSSTFWTDEVGLVWTTPRYVPEKLTKTSEIKFSNRCGTGLIIIKS